MSTQAVTKTKSTKTKTPMQQRMEELTRELEEKNNTIAQQQDEIEHHKYERQLLEERIQWMINQRYAPKHTPPNDRQPELFNEAEALVDQGQAEEPEQEPDQQTVQGYRRRGKRQALPKQAKRIRIEHDLPEELKSCRCCGKPMHRMDEVKSEQLDIVPEKVVVLEHVRFKYACNHCHEDIQTAPLPKQPIPTSKASIGLLAYLIVMKYLDGLPLYRIEKIFDRLGFTQSRTTLARWMIQVSVLAEPLVQRFLWYAQQQPHLHMDE